MPWSCRVYYLPVVCIEIFPAYLYVRRLGTYFCYYPPYRFWPYAPSLKCSEGCKPWVIIARKSSLPYSSFNFGLAQFCALYLQPPIVYCCGVFPAEIAVKDLLPYCICGMLLTSYYMSYSHKVVVKSCRPVVKRPTLYFDPTLGCLCFLVSIILMAGQSLTAGFGWFKSVLTLSTASPSL